MFMLNFVPIVLLAQFVCLARTLPHAECTPDDPAIVTLTTIVYEHSSAVTIRTGISATEKRTKSGKDAETSSGTNVLETMPTGTGSHNRAPTNMRDASDTDMRNMLYFTNW